jgi:hypothetical protein
MLNIFHIEINRILRDLETGEWKQKTYGMEYE